MPRSSLLLSVVFLLGVLVAPPARAQSATRASSSLSSAASTGASGIVMLVCRPQHIRASFQTVRDLRAADALSTPSVEIVVRGKAVRNIRSEDSLTDAIARPSGETVRVLACGMSLSTLGVAPSPLARISHDKISIGRVGLL